MSNLLREGSRVYGICAFSHLYFGNKSTSLLLINPSFSNLSKDDFLMSPSMNSPSFPNRSAMEKQEKIADIKLRGRKVKNNFEH